MNYLEVLKDIFLTNNRYMYIVNGLWFSVAVSIMAAILGLIFGIILVLMKLSHFYPFKRFNFLEDCNPLSKIATIYIDIVRGTPVVVQLMILANVIFINKLRETPILVVGALAFGLNSGAYVAEIIRSGIESLDKGQMEAARSLGLNYFQAMKEVILPQAVRNILPALVSEFITLLKETSIIGFIGGIDLLRSASIITSQTYRGVEPLIAVALIYLLLTSAFSIFMRKIEKGLKNND